MSKVNSSDIINEFAEEMGITPQSAKAYMEFIFDDILKHVEKGDDVGIKGFGKFRMKVTAPRVCTNTYTGKKVNVPARNRLQFEMSRSLLAAYNSSEKERGGETL